MYTSRTVDTGQFLSEQPKYVFWFVTPVVVFLLSGLNVVAQQKSANLRRERIPIPIVKTDLSGTRAGVKITGVGSNTAAARAGLRYGDVLIAYNNRPITNEDELDAVLARLTATGATYWADPEGTVAGEVNHDDGGRGCYFRDPDGHWLEVLTVRYGGRPALTRQARSAYAGAAD